MNKGKLSALGLVLLAAFAGTSMWISGCGGANSPRALADRALGPGNTDEEKKAQEKAVTELGGLPPKDPAVKEQLRRVLKESTNPKVKAQAISALGALNDKASIDMILEAIKSDDRLERAQAYMAAFKLLHYKAAIRPLGTSIEDADPDARQAVYDHYKKTVDVFRDQGKWDTESDK
jgi:hypothetical protein